MGRGTGIAVLAAVMIALSSLQVYGHPSQQMEVLESVDNAATATSSEQYDFPPDTDGNGFEASIETPCEGGQWQQPMSINVLADRVVYTYDTAPADSSLPSPGDFLSGLGGCDTVRMVSAVVADENVVTVFTTDMVSEIETDERFARDPDSGLYLGANINLMTIDEPINYEENVNNEHGSALLEADGRFYLKMSVCFLADIGWTGLNSAAIVLYVDFEASVNFQVTGTIEWERELAAFQCTVGVFWIAWIPVTVDLYWGLEASFDAEGYLSIGAHADAYKAVGMIYANGQWSKHDTGNELTITPTTPEASIDAEARLSMPLGIRTLVFGLAGPYIGLEPYVRAMLSASLTGLDYGLFIGMDVIAGFRCEFWGMVLADYRMTLASWELKVWPSATTLGPSPPRILSNSIDYSHSSPWITLIFQHSDRDQTSGLARYEITRIPTMTMVSLSITSSSPMSWTDAATSYGSVYQYSVVVVANDGRRSGSTTATVTVPLLSIAVRDPPGVTPSSPRLESGTSVSLSWTMPVAGSGNSVDVYLASSSGPLYQLVDGVSNSGTYGSYLWSISPTYPISSPYRIKVVSESRPDVFGYSSTFFNIVTTPRTITVTQPCAGLVITDDSILNIRWQTSGPITQVKIRLASDSQQWWEENVDPYQNTGSLDLELHHFINSHRISNIPLNGSDDFKVVVMDYSNPSVRGESGLFTLIECPPPFRITSPTSMEVLLLNHEATITWDSFTADPTVEIMVSDKLSYWHIGYVPNTGSYTFSVDINNGFGVAQAGRYHIFYVGIRVEGRLWAAISDPILVFDLGDDFEIDDNYTSAKKIVPGYPQYHNFKNYKPDQDWIWFEIGETSNVTIETFNQGPVTDTQMWLFSELSVPGVARYYNNDSEVGNQSSRITAAYLAPGRYYVKVCPGFMNPSEEAYAVILGVEPCGFPRLLIQSPSEDEVLKIGHPYELRWQSSDYPNGSVRLTLQSFAGYAPDSCTLLDFAIPAGAAVYGDLLYVTGDMPNPYAKTVFVFKQSDLSLVASRSFPAGSGVNQMGIPRGIAVDESSVYVCDGSNCRIVKLNKDLSWAGSIGTPGIGMNQFIWPTDVDVVGNMLYVADSGNARIAVVNKNDLSWVTDTGMNSCVGAATGIAAHGDYLYTCGTDGKIMVFDRSTVIPLSSSTIPYSPLWGIAVDSQGLYLTADLLVVRADPGSLEVIDTYDGHGLYGYGYDNHFYGLSGLAMTSEWLFPMDWDLGFVDKVGRPRYDEVLVIADSTENDLSYSWTPQSLSQGRYSILAQLVAHPDVISRSGEFSVVRLPGTLGGVTVGCLPGAVNITWQPNSSDPAQVTYYVVYRNTTMGGWEQMFKGDVSILYFNDTTVRPGCAYRYRAAAGNAYGDGEHTEARGYTVPARVLGLRAMCDDEILAVRLSWNASNVGDMGSAYCVYRSVGEGPLDVYDEANQTNYLDTNTASGKTYRYAVRAVNDVGQGEMSDIVVGAAFGLSIVAGWNFVTVPYASHGYKASTLGLMLGDVVAGWNPTTQMYHGYIVGISPTTSDFDILASTGYWIYTDMARTINLRGDVQTGTQTKIIDVPEGGGWVVVGFESFNSSRNASDILAMFSGGSILMVAQYDSVTGAYDAYFATVPESDFALVVGSAYWLWCTASGWLSYNP